MAAVLSEGVGCGVWGGGVGVWGGVGWGWGCVGVGVVGWCGGGGGGGVVGVKSTPSEHFTSIDTFTWKIT